MGDDINQQKPGRLREFAHYLWNSDSKQFLGRTGASWGKIGFFYLIFYGVLSGFFAMWLAIFVETLDYYEPRFHGEGSILGRTPGMSFMPHPDLERNLIWFSASEPHTYKPYVDSMTTFLENYEEKKKKRTHMECNTGTGSNSSRIHPQEGKVCKFEVEKEIYPLLPDCQKDKEFGYRRGKPCIAIRINKVYGWNPEVLDSNDPRTQRYPLEGRFSTDYVGVSCEGLHAADKENLGPVEYAPKYGFPTNYYPFTNVGYYVEPLVMVQLIEPVRNVLINVKCQLWAKNAEYDVQKRTGVTVFELMVD